MKKKPMEILLVEDEEADIELVKEVLASQPSNVVVTVMNEGEQALAYLRDCNSQSREVPVLVLLDINLPGKNGIEVLKEIKGDRKLKVLPVIIMTSSNRTQDVINTYESFGNAFVHKSVSYTEFKEQLSSLSNFWFETCSLPA